MFATTRSEEQTKLLARDLMSAAVQVIHEDMSLQEAGKLLHKYKVSGAPVVNSEGRCVGVLSASDFVHWTMDGAEGVTAKMPPPCPYQRTGRLLTGNVESFCILSADNCRWQRMQPTTAGGHIALCTLPPGRWGDLQPPTEGPPRSVVQRYMTSTIVTVPPEASLAEVARAMLEAHVHRVIVVDQQGRPIGIITGSDVLAVVAAQSQTD